AGVVIHASDTSILECNPKALSLLGLTQDQVFGKLAIDTEWKFINEHNQPLSLKHYPVNLIKSTQAPLRNLIVGVNRPVTNDVVWALVNGFPVIDAEGNILEIVISFIDMTEHRKLEIDIHERMLFEDELKASKEKAEESEKLKTAFLQNMSHEIRTPLNAISGFIQMLDNPNLSDEKRKSFSSIIKNSSNQLLSIVGDILTISSLETKQEKIAINPVNINSILIELLAIFKQQAADQNIMLYVKQNLSDHFAEIYTDRVKLTQILSNLVSNALKFTSQGSIEFGYNLKQDNLEFFVIDSGIGIPQEQHQKIFERFQQANIGINQQYGGTGLGLAISKGFVELLGGEIWLKSEVNKGATFFFTIPYQAVHAQEADTNLPSSQKKKATVLIAEDVEINFLLLEEIFNELGCTTIHAKNGQEAVDICLHDLNIDVVFMDIKMPILNGYEAAKLIKQARPQLPIIAQTGYAYDDEKEKYAEVFNAYITKPFDLDDLINLFKKFIPLD
ncbi:MAG: response regulator, partial [Chitinophagaceae bacterium]|nr:response regulator [Chitinophagaceae bacterium]